MQDAIILYENGKVIGGEGHPTDADDITFNNTDTDIVANKVGSAIKEVNEKTSGLTRMTKLWENPSPTASFAAQNITLSGDDYDFLLICCGSECKLCPKGRGVLIEESTTRNDSTKIQINNRSFNYISDSSYSVTDATYASTSAQATVYNGYLIPTVIYGIKII